MRVAIANIKVGTNWSREELGDITSLVTSLQIHGLIQPIVLDKDYNLVAGFRRLEAAKTLHWETIDATVTGLPNSDVLNLVENIERSQLSFYQEATAIRSLFPEYSDVKIGEILGRSGGWVRPRTKLWDLPAEIIEAVKHGIITPVHVAVLIASDDPMKKFQMILGGSGRESKKPGIKDLKFCLTKALEHGKLDIVKAIQFALGDITKEQLFQETDSEQK